MNKYIQAILLLTPTITTTGQNTRIGNMPEHEKAIKNSYYITLNNDTVETTILYSDIVKLQRELVTADSNGSVKTFHPGEIKGFGMRNIDSIILATPESDTFNVNEYRSIRKHELVLFINPVYLPAISKPFFNYRFDIIEANVTFPKPTGLYFESASIDSITKLFIHVRFGGNGCLRYLNYYYACHPLHRYPNAIGVGYIELYEKDNKFFDRNISKSMKNGIAWFSKIISDDTLLSNMVKKHKLTQYMHWDNMRSLNIEMLINEYNKWRCSPDKKDTSLTLKGILDADKYYRPSKLVFLGIAAGSVAFLYPGLVTAGIINSHPPKEKNLKIPANCKYCSDEEYLNGYKMRARAIKGKAADNGMAAGLCSFIAAVVIILVL